MSKNLIVLVGGLVGILTCLYFYKTGKDDKKDKLEPSASKKQEVKSDEKTQVTQSDTGNKKKATANEDKLQKTKNITKDSIVLENERNDSNSILKNSNKLSKSTTDIANKAPINSKKSNVELNKKLTEKLYKAESYKSLQQKSSINSVKNSNSSLKSEKPKASSKSLSFEGKVRCKYWPDCKFSQSVFLSSNAQDTTQVCPFWHPDTKCVNNMDCMYGNHCMFWHDFDLDLINRPFKNIFEQDKFEAKLS